MLQTFTDIVVVYLGEGRLVLAWIVKSALTKLSPLTKEDRGEKCGTIVLSGSIN